MNTKKKRKAHVDTQSDEVIGLDVALGLAVKRLREYQNMTQDVLAKKAKVSQTWVSLAENARKTERNKCPSLETLQRIARALGLSKLSKLIRFAEKMTDVKATMQEVEEFIAMEK